VRTKTALIALLALVLGAFGTGCDLEDDGIGRSVVEIVSINDSDPVVSFVQNTDGDILVDEITVLLRNRAYNSFINTPEGSPYDAFVVDQMRIEWVPTVAGTGADALPSYNRTVGFSLAIPRGDTVEMQLPLVTVDMKTAPFLQGLVTGDPGFTATAMVTLIGHESGAPDTVRDFTFGIFVDFAGTQAD
jgi:hypothetical protein